MGAIVLIILDYFLKLKVQNGELYIHWPWLIVDLHFNQGILGGAFGALHPWIIRILFTTFGGFLVFFTFLILYFIRLKPVPHLKLALFLIPAGILGNVWERAMNGVIVDFLIFQAPYLRDMAFNLSDVVLFAGVGLCAYSLLKDYKKIWFEKNLRSRVLIEPEFQYGFSLFICLIGFLNFFIASLYSFAFLKVYLAPENSSEGLSLIAPAILIRDYLMGLFLMQIAFLVVTFGVGIFFSHRLIGPIHAFERYTLDLIEGRSRDLTLRKGDFFRRLESLARRLKTALIKN